MATSTAHQTVHGVDLHELGSSDAHWHHDALSDLLASAVQGGAALGFTSPCQLQDVKQYWVSMQPLLADAERLWIALDGARVIGLAQWRRCAGIDGIHRGEATRLVVHPAHRRRGVARALLAAVERQAHEEGLGLLVLDVEGATIAETVFARLGWRHAGTIPAFGLGAEGHPREFARYWKSLERSDALSASSR